MEGLTVRRLHSGIAMCSSLAKDGWGLELNTDGPVPPGTKTGGLGRPGSRNFHS